MPLRQTNLVEISDLRVLCFGSVFCFLVQSFTPSLIHTSSPHPGPNGTFCTPKMTSKQQTTGTNSELSLDLNASFTILPNKKAKIWSKSQGSPIFGRFFHIIFWTDFFPQLPEPPGSEARGTPEAPRRRHPPGGRGRRRPGHAALPPCGSGARARERFGWPAASKNLVELLVPGGVVGGRCQKIQHSQVWC